MSQQKLREAGSPLQLPAMMDIENDDLENTSYSSQEKKIQNNDSEYERRRQRKSGFFDSLCCCPCSTPVLLGLIAGALTMGIAFATLLSLYLVSPAKTANAITQTTGTSTTSTSATTATTTSATTTTTSTSSSTSSSSTSTTSSRTTSSSSSTSSTTSSTSTTSSSSSTTSSTSTTSTSATTATTTSVTTATTTSTTSATTTSTTTTTTTKPFCTTRITFDDIAGQTATSGIVPNGYNNLNWTNVMYLNSSTVPLSGYPIAQSSPSYVAYNPGGAFVRIQSANGTSFSFDQVKISAGWRLNLEWWIYAYRFGVNKISGSFLINTVNSTTISCGSCTNLDMLIFTASGGTPVDGLAQNGTEFAFDDLCISFPY